MRRTGFAHMECPIARALDEVGEWWSILIIRDAALGVRRFQDFQSRLGIAPTTLTRRLDGLCEHGLLERRRYEDHPPRDEYVLTEKGLDFVPVLLVLLSWGSRWQTGKPSLVAVDAETGAAVSPVVVDARTARPLGPGAVGIAAGPGASAGLRRALAARRPRFGAARSPERAAR